MHGFLALCVINAGLWVCGQTVDDVFRRDTILRHMRSVRDYQLAHPWRETDRNWIRATYYTGVMGLYRASGDPEILEQAIRWAEKHEWAEGNEREVANRKTCGQTYLELYFLKPEPKRIERIRAYVDARMAQVEAGEPPLKGWYYCDTLYVGPPTIAMLGKATGEQKYYDYLNRVYWTVVERLYDREYKLFYRDASYFDARSKNGKKVFWSRGNGWVLGGIPRVLEYLPRDNPFYDRYVDLFRAMAESIASRQGDDGLWRSNLDDPDEYPNPETSGTAFFCYAMAWGINQGVLERDQYLPVVMRAWEGLVRHVQPDGKLGYVQPVGAAPAPAFRDQTHEYAMGLFLLAGEQMIKLVDSKTIDQNAIDQLRQKTRDLRDPTSSIVPAPAAPSANVHPLQSTIDDFLEHQRTVRDFAPTDLSRDDYLRVIAGQVAAMRRYQDSHGRIIDPVEKREAYYSTPCYAHSVAALAASGYVRDPDLWESGMKALDAATSDMAAGNAANGHGDFFTWPAVFAYELFSDVADTRRRADWKRRLEAVNREKLYRARDERNNWNVVNLAGEFLRSQNGMTNMTYVENFLGRQLTHFTALGMYSEHGNPLPYDLFPRHYLAGMLHRGYRGELYATYRRLLWRGAWMSLLMQSPAGELPTGYRSSHHIWNEAEEAVVFEIYARHCAAAGRHAEAGAFKRAAHLALASIDRWIRPDGTGYIVKNRFPIESRHGYESYSAHTTYNLLACSMLAQAWQFADDQVAERPAPADLGGFVVPVLDPFHKVFANAGGTYVEYDTNGDHIYNPTGLIRIHLLGGHPQLGPSDGCAPKFSGPGVNYAVGPEWKDASGWHRLAAMSPPSPDVEIVELSPRRVALRVQYQPDVSILPRVVTGRFGQAWKFNDARSQFSEPHPVRLDTASRGNYTIALWFQRDTRDTRSALLSGTIDGEHALYLELQDPNTIRFVHRVPPGSRGGTELIGTLNNQTRGQWHHVAINKEGKKLRLCIDGEPLASGSTEHPLSDPVKIHLANLYGTSNDRHFFGTIDELLIYDRALTEDEIKQLRRNSKPEDGLLASWSFDEPLDAPTWMLTETITVEPARVTVHDRVSGVDVETLRIHYPMLVFDGLHRTSVRMAGNTIELRLDGRGTRVVLQQPSGAIWHRSGSTLSHRNGHVEIATAEFSGSEAVYYLETCD